VTKKPASSSFAAGMKGGDKAFRRKAPSKKGKDDILKGGEGEAKGEEGRRVRGGERGEGGGEGGLGLRGPRSDKAKGRRWKKMKTSLENNYIQPCIRQPFDRCER